MSSCVSTVTPIRPYTKVPASTETPKPPVLIMETPTFSPIPPYFIGFPVEYQVIKLPSQIIDKLNHDGSIVPLPKDIDPLIKDIDDHKGAFDLTQFDLKHVISFTLNLEHNFIAAPASRDGITNTVHPDWGTLAALVYDKKTADMYTIWFTDEKAFIVDQAGRIKRTMEGNDSYFFDIQDPPVKTPLILYIKNGCWLCWSLDGRCGCLVCL